VATPVAAIGRPNRFKTGGPPLSAPAAPHVL
jgi:hypothetical protein